MANLELLRDAVRRGERPEYLFFWGHTASRGPVGKECLSQWYPAEFEADGQIFPTAEHYMMYHKALLFGDRETAGQVLGAPSPKAAKALGRRVRGFEETVWNANRYGIVVNGNYAKFSQNPVLLEYLLDTRPRVLVEASPTDRVWGIGLAAADEFAADPLNWRGLNLLGFALMDVRERLGAQRPR